MRRYWLAALSIFFLGATTLHAQDKKVVKIAFIGPLSGSNAEIGLSARNSFDLAVKQANASGKLPFVIEPMILDDEANPATGVSAALKAVSDPKVAAITGHYNSPVALAAIHTYHKAGVPIILWGTVSPDITNKFNYPEVTRVVPTLETQSKVAAEFLEKKGLKNWVVIHDTTDFGVQSKETFVKSIGAKGGKVMAVNGVTTGTTDFRPILTQIKSMKDVQGVYLGTNSLEGALIRDQMQRLGMKNLVALGNTGIAYESFNKVAGASAEGVLATGFTSPGDHDAGRKLMEEYKKNYKETFSETSGPPAYDATNIIIQAIAQVGSQDKQALAKKIRATHYKGAFGETAFDEFGQTKFGGIVIKVSEGGRWVPFDRSSYASGKKKLADN